MDKIPRSNTDDYTDEMALERKEFIEDKTGKKIEYITAINSVIIDT